jgi:hypothetical protein
MDGLIGGFNRGNDHAVLSLKDESASEHNEAPTIKSQALQPNAARWRGMRAEVSVRGD